MLTPTEVLAARVADLEARIELGQEREFYLVAEVARLNALIGETRYRTMPIEESTL